jgi:hypothetical protein
MLPAMPGPMNLIPTRESLLSRLRDWADDESWSEFFHTYWRMLYEVALRAGLREDEAQEVVQETVIAVAKKMPGFHYDAAIGLWTSSASATPGPAPTNDRRSRP